MHACLHFLMHTGPHLRACPIISRYDVSVNTAYDQHKVFLLFLVWNWKWCTNSIGHQGQVAYLDFLHFAHVLVFPPSFSQWCDQQQGKRVAVLFIWRLTVEKRLREARTHTCSFSHTHTKKKSSLGTTAEQLDSKHNNMTYKHNRRRWWAGGVWEDWEAAEDPNPNVMHHPWGAPSLTSPTKLLLPKKREGIHYHHAYELKIHWSMLTPSKLWHM